MSAQTLSVASEWRAPLAALESYDEIRLRLMVNYREKPDISAQTRLRV
jgi:hypothetical protein